MPRGVPKTGTRKPGGGRKKKFDIPTVRKRIPKALAEKIEDIHHFLVELDDEISEWEQVCDEKSTSPRYDRARQLVLLLREKLDALGLDTISKHSDNENNKQGNKS
ncbi:hypothetical protein [Nostoc sp. NMS9]|uniref:hypothetical protein n=1 Tax=Nostoc sp. NMS9 TaxID=2815393 RepID=UPI0025FF8B1C|nr:hypothetical protein [Nostoc sp. NMS9]MBN3944112.1 hypothetical protein [Nostoc sp. NMS9]